MLVHFDRAMEARLRGDESGLRSIPVQDGWVASADGMQEWGTLNRTPQPYGARCGPPAQLVR